MVGAVARQGAGVQAVAPHHVMCCLTRACRATALRSYRCSSAAAEAQAVSRGPELKRLFKVHRTILPLLGILGSGLLAFSAIPIESADQQAGRLDKTASERAGLPFAWDVVTGTYATPGTSLVIVETQRFKLGKSTSIEYELRATGFSPEEKPLLAERLMNETYRPLPFVFDKSDPGF